MPQMLKRWRIVRLCKNKEDAVVIENEERDDVDLNKQRNLAIQELIAIEAKFAEVRDKLFKDKLSLLEKITTMS